MAALITACGGGSDNDNDDLAGFGIAPGSSGGGTAEVRVLHAVDDAPLVNVLVNGDEVLPDIDFRTGSGFLELAPGDYDILVEALVPGAPGSTVDIIEETLNFGSDTRTTILAIGEVAPDTPAAGPIGTVGPLVVENPTEPIGAGNLRIQVTHASPDAPPVYLAVTTPGFPIDQAEYLGPLSYTQSTGGIQIPAGDYQIRVAVGTPDPSFEDSDVVFDSGALSLSEGLDLQAVAVTSTVPSQSLTNPSPISVVLLDGTGSSDLFDAQTGADLRVVHNSPGAPAVDVIVDVVATPADENLTIVSNLIFGNFAGYLSPAVAPTAYDVSVVLSENTSVEALNFVADLMPGLAYTVIANDVVSNITEWVLVDDNRRVATETKVRLVHGSPSAGTVDIYVFPSSTGLLPG
ncbi:MAG: DUF4397 domain-containing protein, partial [Gammaproteobacteria bacterium]